MAEKSEKATPKKLRDARKKGQVAKSQDFPAALTFIVSISGMVIMSGFFYKKLASYMVNNFNAIKDSPKMETQAAGYISAALHTILSSSIPLIIVVSLTGVLVGFLVVGPTFSMEAMKPDIKRLNPVDNLKNMFKLKTFIELLKSIIKITGAFILIYTVLKKSVPLIISTAGMPPLGAALVFSKFLVQVAIRVGIFFLIVAVFDLIFQKRQFAKQMMMEKFQIKQEIKDTEGDPQIKGKRRQIAREMAYQEGPRAVRRAKAVITNPTHIAVAIEYDAEEVPAPKIIVMGKGQLADEIIRLAHEFNIPIMRNVPLAHELSQKGNPGQFIPEETFAAVAEILKWVAELEKAEKAEKLEAEFFSE
ncbi:MAG: type III secretion system export apparatus subunit SctU [Simkaniaceae bacterium]